MNPESSVEYLQGVQHSGSFWNRSYEFAPSELKLLHATRHLAALRIDRLRYEQAFKSDICDDYAEELEPLAGEELLDVSSAAVSLTARGMFYADSIAAVLAHRRLGCGHHRLGRASTPSNDNGRGHM